MSCVSSAWRQRVAVAARVGGQRRAAQLQRIAVDVEAVAVPRDLAQADALLDRRLAGDLDAQRVAVRSLGRPQGGVVDDDRAADRARLALRDGHVPKAQGVASAAAAERAGQRPRRRARGASQAHADVDASPAAVIQARAQMQRAELARADPRERHRPVQPAVVEPRALPVLVGLALGVAPVDAHRDGVAALRERRSSRERLVRAGVTTQQLAVDVHPGAMVGGLERQRVAPVLRSRDLAGVPADAAVVRAPARGAAVGPGVRRMRDRDVAPAPVAVGPAAIEAEVVRVGAVAPARERDRAAAVRAGAQLPQGALGRAAPVGAVLVAAAEHDDEPDGAAGEDDAGEGDREQS